MAERCSAVPFIPDWFAAWGCWIALCAAIPFLVWVASFGHAHGDGYGWALLMLAGLAVTALWWADYDRRYEAARRARAKALSGALEMTKVDQMSGRQFEEFCVELLPLLGYRDVTWVGNVKHRQDVDITATAPDGTLVAVECKRLKGTIDPRIINALAGATASGPYRGRTGIVMSTARATAGALRTASRNNIQVIDRQPLQQLMAQARCAIDGRGSPSKLDQILDSVEAGQPIREAMADAARSWLSGMRLPGQVAVRVVPAGAIAFSVILLLAPSVPARTLPQDRPAAGAVPGSVVRAYFSAISEHHWQDVWQLGGKDLGRGLSTTYSGMISGYRLTGKDVVTAMRVSGSSVTGRFLAYETTGAVQVYEFTYTVRDGTIVAGQQVLAASSGSGPAASR